MFTHCHQCGYENGPNYRFCGMCGAPLESPAPAKAPAVDHSGEVKQAPVSGPSFLGLAEEPGSDVDYLLEDDEPRSSHWRLYLALVILVVAAGLIWARWRQYGYPWAAQTTATAQPAATPGDQEPKVEPVAPSPIPAEGAPQTPAAQEPKAAPPASESSPTAALSTSEGANVPSATPQSRDSSGAASISKPEPAAAPPPKAVPKPNPKPSPPAAAVSADDRLAAEGEKYLYGNGVPADCGRAMKDLSAAAARSNAKAQSLLGAMYATGHCSSRDLPTAYRWFAKALHNDPSNVRLERDLQMVWNQMTPGERSLATRAQ